MSTPTPRNALLAGLAGWIPFWIPPLLAIEALSSGRSAAAEQAFFTIYAAIILGFLGGVRWGRALAGDIAAGPGFFALTTAPSVLGLAAVFIHWAGQPALGFIAVLGGLLAHLAWDRRAVARGELPRWYGRLRLLLTAGAALAALVMLGVYALALR